MEGQRDRPMRRSRPSRPIEDKRCYECGVLGHLSYDCPKLQVQGEFTNVMRINQPSYDELGEGSSDELMNISIKQSVSTQWSCHSPLIPEGQFPPSGLEHVQELVL